MENTVILYAAQLSERVFKKEFASKSAFGLVLEWASNAGDCNHVAFFVSENTRSSVEKEIAASGLSDKKKISIRCRENWTKGDFVSEISSVLSENKSDYGIISFADTPFLNSALTKELAETHVKYSAEYTFADGYPYGFSPELIDRGAAAIIASLCASEGNETASQKMSRDALFSIMSGDINSFEIETVLAEKDYRLLRFEFETSSKINFMACRNAFEMASGKISDVDIEDFCDALCRRENVLKTVPAFYNIQISSAFNHKLCYFPELPEKKDMDLEKFRALVSEIAEFSEKAVVSLSCLCEPLLNPSFVDFAKEVLSHQGLSLLIETDGTLLDEKIAEELSVAGKDRINWIVLLDAMDRELYSKLHSCDSAGFDKALNSVVLLEKYFEGHVYPQFVRMKANEHCLEAFFRFWKEKESPSKGDFIIQKYNSFCGLLPDEKSADLSPLQRNPCWHLRRDLTVLCDGTVPLCIQLFRNPLGNVFDEGLQKVWAGLDSKLKEHADGIYSGCCGTCDDHYTYNF